MMMRGWPVLIVAAAVLLAGCAGSPPDEVQALEADDTPAADPQPDTQEIYLVATDYAGYGYPQSWFKIRPADVDAKAGQPISLTYKSALGNQQAHDLRFEGLEASVAPLTEGESKTIVFSVDAAGTYAYFCSIDNHRELGMQGVLTVGA